MANEETNHQISNGIHSTNPLDFQWPTTHWKSNGPLDIQWGIGNPMHFAEVGEGNESAV